MTMMFRPVPETTDFALKVAASIAGSSGTGKTYSACLLARGLTSGKPFAFIDTENRRALHYRRDFPEMRHFDFGPQIGGEMVGFPPERWIAILDQIEATGVDACVIDSLSHAWEGIGGVLELQAMALDKLSGGDSAKAERVGQLAWAQVKPRWRRLVERIVQAKMHVVLCIRAKPVMQDAKKGGNARPTKLRRPDLPWDIACDKDLVFEMGVSLLMVPERPGQPELLKCPDHFRPLFANGSRVSAEIGQRMRAWADGGGFDPKEKALLDAARMAARGGTAAFTGYWQALAKDERAVVRTIMPELEHAAKDADQRQDDAPFAPSPDDLAAAEAAALAEIAARDAEVAV